MFGMSAKDRMAMFENKSNTPKKGSNGPKKIGKLKVPNSKPAEEPKKTVPPKKPKAKDENKDKLVETKKEEIKKEETKQNVPEKKKEPEPNKNVKQADSVSKTETKSVDPIKKEEAQATGKDAKVGVKEVVKFVKKEEALPAKKENAKPDPVKQEEQKPSPETVTKEVKHPLEPAKKDVKPQVDPANKDVKPLEPAQKDVKPPSEPAKKDVKPPSDSAHKDVKPPSEPVNKDVKPPSEPANKDVKPQSEPTKKDVKPPSEPAKKDIKPPSEPANKDVKPASEPTNNKDVKPPSESAKTDVKPPSEPAKKDATPSSEPAQKVVKPSNEPVKKDDKPPAELAKKEVKQPSQKFEKRPSQPSKKEDTKEVSEKSETKEQESKDVSASEKEIKQEPPKETIVRKRRRPQYIPVPEEFFDTLFYFSGMGTVVGSAMNEGVYVPQRATKTALDSEVIDEVEVEKEKERDQDTFMIRTARTQAFNITEELRKLHGLLNALPNFGEQQSDLHKIDVKPVDSVMHARYHNFQQVAQGPPRAKPADVPKQEIPKPVTQWPPPIDHPKPQKEAPISMDTTTPAQVKPVSVTGKDKNVGVFKGVPGDKSSKDDDKSSESGIGRPYGVYTAKLENPIQPWQDKYGAKSVEDVRAPQPFHQEGEIPSGLKPWELSRLRGLEARGYQFAHYEPQSGADHSDSFYHGSASLELEDMEISSLAPYLVSGKSQSADRHQQEVNAPVTSATFSLKKHTGYGQYGENLPYCDL